MARSSGLYLYAIMDSAISVPHDYCTGIHDQPIQKITVDRVAAVVSDAPNGRMRPERRHLAAHQNVLKHLMRLGTILPMSFGIIADDRGSVQELLQNYQTAFAEQLERVAGKMEMSVRVAWEVPNIFEYFVLNHPPLKEERDRLLAENGRASRDEMLDLGQEFERLLNEEREERTEWVEQSLAPHCFEIKRNPPKKETEIMDLVCLVGRDGLTEFENAIARASEPFDDHYVFQYNGPWAPHNFVQVNIEL